MKISDRLNLVIPIYSDDDVATITHYVHSAPISREVFEAHFLLISKTFAAIYAEGLGEIAGPRVAALVMRTVARQQRDEEGYQALMNEIRRLSNVLTRSGGKWVMAPMQDAIDGQMISDDDLAEVENAIAYFTSSSCLHRRQTLSDILNGAARLWGAQITSLGLMAFAASLPTLTAIENTGESLKPASSVPY